MSIKKFSIPDYYGKSTYLADFIKYQQDFPQYFYSDRIIDSSYGAHPTILWTGGRIIHSDTAEKPMETILDELSNIELRHVCTNLFITPEVLTDYRTNYFLQHYVRPQDKLIIANKVLKDYLKEHYPNIDYIYSTTMNIIDLEKINKITKNHIYVLNYNYNNDNDYLKKLKYPEHIEVICAEPCMPNCPNRIKHYEEISKAALGLEEDKNFHCLSNSEYKLRTDLMKLSTAITSERVDELANMGIQYFKISGRILKIPAWLDLLVYYLVLPEHREYVYLQLMDAWW